MPPPQHRQIRSKRRPKREAEVLRVLRACGLGLALLSSAMFFVALTPMPVAAAAEAAAAGRLTIDTSAGYARLLFSFAAPTQVTAAVADGILTVHAPRSVELSAEAVAEQLGSYVSSARRDADGTYRFALNAPVALHSSTQGNRTAIDLVPAAYRGTPPDLPAPPAPPRREPVNAAELPVLKVRVAEYANYTRVVFEWPQRIPYSAYPGKGRISLRFTALARPDFSTLEARTPAWVKTAGWRIDGDTLVVDIDTDAESTFQHLRNGNSVAVDIFAPAPDASRVAPAVAAAPAQKTPVQTAPAAASPAAPAVPAANAAVAAPEKPAAALPTRAELTRDGLALRFPDARGKAVAVFSRGALVWIVLDGHAALDPVALLAGVTSLVDKAETSQSDGAAILRLALKKPLVATVRETDASLDVIFAAADRAPPTPVTLERKGANGRTSLAASLPGSTHALALADAEAGDHIWIVPAGPGRAVLTTRRFVDLEVLPSAAGLAVVPRADDLDVMVTDETVTISRPRGLSLATLMGVAPQPVVDVQTGAATATFLDFARWGRSDTPDVYMSIRELRAAVAKLPAASMNKARLRLAQYMLAQSLAPEALGEITLMREADPKLQDDPQLTLMTAAAQFMIGRAAEARQTLAKPGFDGDPHAAIWRGLAEASLKDWLNARRDLQLGAGVLRSYPDTWQARVQLSRADLGLTMGDLSTANDALDQLPGTLSEREKIEAEYHQARLLAAQGHVNEAVARLSKLENGRHPPVAARAILTRVELQLAGKKIKPLDAIETLERLRYRWRGDDVELNTLRRLGAVYTAQKLWHEGLDVLRTAALNFPNSEQAREAQDDMRMIFSDLFLNGKADTLEPVQALSLFYDFIELTPIGRDGDEMIRRLSDRLVAIDLLGPAEELLQHQVDQRLEGVSRAVVATQLATIYLVDRKPKDTLRVIADTRQTGLPEELNTRRRLLEARAMAELKQYDAALELIADDETPETKQLRADISWQASNWDLAAVLNEELLGEVWQGPKPLTEEQRLRVLRAAVSYSLAGDALALVRLNEHYGAKMAKTPDANAFAVVTQNTDGDGVAMRELVKRLASVQTLQAFMTEFRGRSQKAAAVARN
jgi:hypothetical protein